jgi:photosystem I P700 chlorophyll a apoprotein A2
MSIYDSFGLRLNVHIGWFGLLSVLWAGHLMLVSIPVSRGLEIGNVDLFNTLFNGSSIDSPGHIFGSSIGAGTSVLTFIGGLKQDTASLYLSDVAHHHLAIGVLFIFGAHLYASVSKAGLGSRIRDIISGNGNLQMIRHLGKSLDLSLAFALGGVSVITSIVATVISTVSPYPFLSFDYVTTAALYVHHQWIASFCVVGAGAHFGIFFVRHGAVIGLDDPFGRLLSHRAALISHLSYVTLWLGFHTLAIYVHNDAVTAFGQEEKQII